VERAESRRAIFARLNAADVRAKQTRSRKASRDINVSGVATRIHHVSAAAERSRKSSLPTEPLVFEVPLGDEGATQRRLPRALAARLQLKTRVTFIKSATDLQTRKQISAAARVAFANKDRAATEAAAR